MSNTQNPNSSKTSTDVQESKVITPKIDSQDPLYVHPSDTPNLDLVTDVLRGTENYNVWSREFLVALEAKNKIGFIDGTCKPPEPESNLFPHWKRCNALVKSWLHRSLSRDLIHGVIYCDSAHLIWVDLKERFDRINGARLYALYRQINTIIQGTNSVTIYYSKLRELWDEYDSLTLSPSKIISKEYIEFCGQLKMMQFLMGLNECYGTIRSQILMMSPLPSHGQVYSMVLNEETQRGINVQPSRMDTSVALSSNSSQNKGQDRDSLYCEHCSFHGHTIDNCFKLHGYPPNKNSGGRRGGRRGASRGNGYGRGITNQGRGTTGQGRGFNVNSAATPSHVPSPQSNGNNNTIVPPALTPQQYQQIVNMIGSMSTDNQSFTAGTSTNLATVSTEAVGETHLGSQSKTWKILSYNVWFREDLEMHNRMRALGNLIELHSPDVICFQEVIPEFYEIFQRSNWWKGYCCSIPNSTAFPGGYFCMQLSKLPVKSYSCRPFNNSIMGRELCIAEVEVTKNTSLFVATSHLESPCPSPPTWNQMFSKERVQQANEAVKFLEKNQNVIFCGDMNWDDKLDGPFPLSDGWRDAWTETRPGEVGFTYDTKSNKMISGNKALQKRLDRFVCKLNDFKISGIEMIGMDEIPGLSYVKEKRVKGQVKELVLPVLPSDHYGLLLTISPGDSA